MKSYIHEFQDSSAGTALGKAEKKRHILYAFFWIIPRRLNFKCRRFGTLCSIFIGRDPSQLVSVL